MCGISGIFSHRPDSVLAAIERMVGAMQHRGPDGRGTFVEAVDEGSAVAIGHNRLSIIDLSDHAAQPMRSEDGRFVLAYNGEVYNYRELAKELPAGSVPPGAGDTAVVLAALRHWGPAAFARFNGMWAILLYDRVDKTLLVSRDRFGVKPLYYHEDNGDVLFASEVKAILEAQRTRFTINPDVAVPYLTRGLLNFSPGTFFNEVHQFPTAAYAVIALRGARPPAIQAVRYWHHPFELGRAPEAGQVAPAEIRELFIDAVRLRLRSDVPVGVLLSGGVDSSAIVGAVAALGQQQNLTVLSVTSNDPRTNEEVHIDRMAAWADVAPKKVNVSAEPLALLDRLADACWFNDEPVCGVADIAELRLMELARSLGLKVLLSGQGADEQLGGYNKFLYFWVQQLARDHRWGQALATLLRSARSSNTLYEFKLSEAIRYIGKRRLSAETFIATDHGRRDTLDIGLGQGYSHREWRDLTCTSIPALLHYEDRMSMCQSVEVRIPFLDYRLVDRLAVVHPSEKFAGGWTKSIFRRAIDGMVPPEIQYRRDKKGFTVPEDRWMRGEFQGRVAALFAGEMQAARRGIVDAAKLRSLYAAFTRGQGMLNGRHFFRAVAFETFLRRFDAYLRM
jgi:asparagine synthase (glutamine-hydrolysing)